MPHINSANKLYLGSQSVAAAYMAGVQVWPSASSSTLSASLRLMTASEVPGGTSPWCQVTTAFSGVTPASYKYYSSTNGGGWVFRYEGGAGPHNFDTTYSSTFRMKVDSFDANGNGIQSVTTNTVTTGAAPVVNVQRTWQGRATAAATYKGSNAKRTDSTGTAYCFYGYFDSTQGQQKSLVIFAIPAEIRNCVSVDRVQLSWYNNHHFKNTGGTVSLVGHHGPSLPATFPGSTGPLLNAGAQVKWPAPKPGQINGTTWFDLAWLTSSGRTNIAEEIRVNNLQGFGLIGAETGKDGYGYAAINPLLDITYTVRI